MRKLILIAALLLCTRCTDAWRSDLVRSANAIADVANASSTALRARYCEELMQALGRIGTWTPAPGGKGGHCAESGPRAGTPATGSERSELDTVKIRWRPIREAQQELAAIDGQLVDALNDRSLTNATSLPSLLVTLAEHYAAMVSAVRALGIDLPALGGAP